MKTINLTEKEFVSRVANFVDDKEWKYLGDKPAIVDFYASRCRPCQITAAVLDELAVAYSNDIYIYKVDIKKEVRLSQVFGIHSIPTLLLIPMDGSPKMLQGAVPKKDLVKAINKVLLENVEV